MPNERLSNMEPISRLTLHTHLVHIETSSHPIVLHTRVVIFFTKKAVLAWINPIGQKLGLTRLDNSSIAGKNLDERRPKRFAFVFSSTLTRFTFGADLLI